MAADGSIVIDVELDGKEAQQELNMLTRKIENLRAELQKAGEKRLPLVKQAEELGAKLEEAKAKLEEMTNAESGVYTTDAIEAQRQAVEALQKEWEQAKLNVEKYDTEVLRSEVELMKSEERAGELSQQLAGVGDSAKKSLDDAGRSAAKAKSHIAGLVKSLLLVSVIKNVFTQLGKWVGYAMRASEEASTALRNLRGALLTAIQPIIQAVVPALTTLVNALTRVVSAVAAVLSVLFGTTVSASADAADALNDEKDALDGVGGAAKDASKQMANFDEINQLTQKDNGGGGKTADFTPLFDAIKDFKLPDWLENFLESLRITIKDVVFDWSNLTGEQIAEKMLVGLFALAGGVFGFMLGGVPGALIGTLAGLVVGLVISSLIFNHDGKLSGSEILKSLMVVLLAILGGIAGFNAALAITGANLVAGALIGVTIGVAIALAILAISWSHKNKVTEVAHSSPLGDAVYAMLNDSKASLEAAADLKLRIDSVTSEISDEQLAEIKYAEELIHKIFELDQEDNKTAEQIAVINALIDELNGMGLDGIQLSFDETTGHVNQTEDAVLAVLDALKEQYRLEASHDALVEQYKNEIEAKQKVKENTEKLQEATEKYNEALSEQEAAYQALQEAQTQYALYWNSQGDEFNTAAENLAAAKLAYEAATTTVGEAKEAVGNFAEALDVSVDSYEAAKRSIEELETEHENLVKKINESADGAKEGGKAIMGGEKKGLEEGYQETEDFLVSAQEALQDAANVANGIHSPSTVYADMGKHMMEGLANGITDNAFLAEDALRNVCNSLSALFERGINGVIGQYNGLASKLNESGGVSLPMLSDISVPRLAAGAVIPPNSEFLAVLGDQKSGTNIEAPLETIVAAFRQALSDGAGNRNLVLKIGEYEFGSLVFNAFNAESGRIGTSMVR